MLSRFKNKKRYFAPPTSSVKHLVKPKKKLSKSIKIIIISLFGILVSFPFGIFLFNFRTRLNNTKNSDTKNERQEVTNDEQITVNFGEAKTIKPEKIVINFLQLPLNSKLYPIFAAGSTGKYNFYLTDKPLDIDNFKTCVSDLSCTDYPLYLQVSNSLIPEKLDTKTYIKSTNPEINIDNLQETIIDGNTSWWGYTDNEKNKHITIIEMVSENPRELYILSADKKNSNLNVISEYLSSVSQIKMLKHDTLKNEYISDGKAYIAEYKSSMLTDDFANFKIISSSLLNTKQFSTSDYLYYVKLNSVSSDQPKNINYPKDDFLNQSYYIYTNNQNLSQGIYGTEQVQINIKKGNTKNLELYLKNQKYCENADDCIFRTDFCTLGAYNKYHQFTTPGDCRSAQLEDFGYTKQETTKLECQDISVNFDSIKCETNLCQFVNPTPYCLN